MNNNISYISIVATGRFIQWEDFDKHLDVDRSSLHSDCVQVILYMHDFIIQVTKDNEFYVKIGRKEIKHKSLDVVESALWYLKAEKVINSLK